MRLVKVFFGVGLVALGAIFLNINSHARTQSAFPLPEFTQSDRSQWINSDPLRLRDLSGKVVLVDIWTYGCWNCYRSIPWLRSLEARYSDKEFVVVGIHTPEFEHEYVRKNIEQKVAEFKVTHPVMMDNDFAYWKALGNQYWPTFYIADQKGMVRGVFIGETHEGDRRAREVERLIERLLNEHKSG